ncbi:MAG: NAD(P)/FAD-dependent oxidoreductase [Candidatus Omnitrophota bacterium]
MEKVDITIVGAGVIGLAAAYELSKVYSDIVVIERNSCFGQETSSRNSEVIHAGIYYPKNSLKAKTCVEGRRLVYDYCQNNHIDHKKIGKLITAINTGEIKALEELYKNSIENGVHDLKFLSEQEAKRIEPNIKARAAIYSPSTGIIDSHDFMKSLASNSKADIVYETELVGVDKAEGGFKVYVEDKREGGFSFWTKVFINCGGLNADKIAEMIRLDKEEYKLKYCKGDYFRVHNNKAKYINRLIYPVPVKSKAGLGIHATLDLGGGLRLGPDDEYVDEINYDVDEAKAKAFYESVKTFLPFIEEKDLGPDTSGIRPKLQGKEEDFRDFLIKDEADNGLEGFINLIGIESPGLTASLSIAKIVKRLAKELL